MVVNVTQQDIEAGLRGRSRACPIALALRRQGVAAEVDSFCIHISEDYAIPVADSVIKWISVYDNGGFVGPISFDLAFQPTVVAGVKEPATKRWSVPKPATIPVPPVQPVTPEPAPVAPEKVPEKVPA